MQRSIRVVFFDIGGTLAYPHPSFHALIAQVCQTHGLDVTAEDAERAEPAVWAKIAARDDAGRGFSFSRDRSRAFWIWVYQTFLIEIGRADAAATDLPERLLETFVQLENYRLYEDALPVLERLHGTDLRLGVISNWEEWLEQLMAHLEISHYFDFVVVSGTTGIEKPDAEIFHRALEAAGVTPAEAVHVGDSLRDDVHGAAAVGIHPILLDRNDRFFRHQPGPDQLAGPPLARVRSLLEIPELLGL